MSDLYDEPSCVDEPNLVECEHCGELFDKVNIDGEDICPVCEKKITQCCFCDERIFTDGPHFTAPNGMKFCNDKCYEEYLKEIVTEMEKTLRYLETMARTNMFMHGAPSRRG